MLSSSIRNRRRGNIAGARGPLLPELRVDGLAFRRIRRLDGDRLEALRLPVDRGDVVGRLEEILGGLQVDLLSCLRARLERLPDEVVQVRERLQVIRFEVVAPQDADLGLRDLRMLLLDEHVAGELRVVLLPLFRRRVRAGLLELEYNAKLARNVFVK